MQQGGEWEGLRIVRCVPGSLSERLHLAWHWAAGTGTLDPAPSISASGPNSATIHQSIIVIQRVGPASCAAPREIVLGTEQVLHWQAERNEEWECRRCCGYDAIRALQLREDGPYDTTQRPPPQGSIVWLVNIAVPR